MDGGALTSASPVENFSRGGEDEEMDGFSDPLAPGVRVMMTTLQLLLCLLGTVGNVCMFSVILRDSSLRVWGNYLHLSLAALHLIGCLVISPLYLVSANDLLLEGSILRKLWCRTVLSGKIGYSVGNCVLLSQIALCRCYILVSGNNNMVQPHWSGKLWPAWLVIGLVFGGTFAGKPSKSELMYRVVTWSCIADDNYFTWQIQVPFVVPVICTLVVICICALIVSYVRIICWVRRKRRVNPVDHIPAPVTVSPEHVVMCLSPVNPKQPNLDENNPLTQLYQQATRKNFLLLIFFTVSFLPTLFAIIFGMIRTISGQKFILFLDISWIFFYLLPVASPMIFILGREKMLIKMVKAFSCLQN